PDAGELPIEEAIGSYVRKKANIRKSKASRQDILGALPIKKIICKTAEEERICELCGEQMVPSGEHFVREDIQIIPAKIYRIHYYAETYMCPKCKEEDDIYESIQAEAPLPLLKHSYASPSTVAYIMYQKYFLYVPLYRQELDWLQLGVRMSRQTMANWINQCAIRYFKPIYDLLHKELLTRDIAHADEVPCQVLHEDGKTAQSKSYEWVYMTGNDGLPGICLYEYQPGRSGDYPKEFLKGFNGFLHCDAYQGYNKVEEIQRIGCMAHCRRYFFDAIPKNRKKQTGNLPSETGVAYCNRLFEIERELKELTPEERCRERELREKPVLDQFFSWAESLSPAGGSRLATAVTYALNQKDNLMGYLKDGRLELSNSAAERKVKSYVMGRKNFLFHNSVKGAEASSIIYSLIETAKMNNLNVYEYLYQLLLYMPGYKKEPEGMEDMLPWSDFMKAICSKTENVNPEVRLKS
ncbi:MAG: IS66 family transposase, partial [Dorea sp.]|nr:IS66 family transposase [Dorea sp.]